MLRYGLLAIEPANIVLVTVPVSAAVIAVPAILVLSIAAEALMSALTITLLAICVVKLTLPEPLKETAEEIRGGFNLPLYLRYLQVMNNKSND